MIAGKHPSGGVEGKPRPCGGVHAVISRHRYDLGGHGDSTVIREAHTRSRRAQVSASAGEECSLSAGRHGYLTFRCAGVPDYWVAQSSVQPPSAAVSFIAVSESDCSWASASSMLVEPRR